MSDFVTVLDQLVAATQEGKDLVRDLHGAVKDARAVLKDIAVERQRVESMVRRSVEERLDEAVQEQLAELGKATQKAMRESVDKVLREFAKLESAIFTGGVKRRDSLDLRDMVR